MLRAHTITIFTGDRLRGTDRFVTSLDEATTAELNHLNLSCDKIVSCSWTDESVGGFRRRTVCVLVEVNDR